PSGAAHRARVSRSLHDGITYFKIPNSFLWRLISMIAIIDYQMGNPGSIHNMLTKIGVESVITSCVEDIQAADKLILPGVGAFDNAMLNLHHMGLISTLHQKVLEKKTPILGICLGMQLFSRCSEEGMLPGLGWLDAKTIRFRFEADQSSLRLPHMGWNT